MHLTICEEPRQLLQNWVRSQDIEWEIGQEPRHVIYEIAQNVTINPNLAVDRGDGTAIYVQAVGANYLDFTDTYSD